MYNLPSTSDPLVFSGLAEEFVIDDEAIDNELVSSSSANKGDTVVKSFTLLLLLLLLVKVIESLFSLFLIGDLGNGTEIVTEFSSLLLLLAIVFFGEVRLAVFEGVVVFEVIDVLLDDLNVFLSTSRPFVELIVFEISGFVLLVFAGNEDESFDDVDVDEDENFFNFSLIELATLILEDGF